MSEARESLNSTWLCPHAVQTRATAHEVLDAIESMPITTDRISNVPLINSDGSQTLVMEWWYKERKITVFVIREAITYLKVWGYHIDDEMEDGEIQSIEDLCSLWKWLQDKGD